MKINNEDLFVLFLYEKEYNHQENFLKDFLPIDELSEHVHD